MPSLISSGRFCATVLSLGRIHVRNGLGHGVDDIKLLTLDVFCDLIS